MVCRQFARGHRGGYMCDIRAVCSTCLLLEYLMIILCSTSGVHLRAVATISSLALFEDHIHETRARRRMVGRISPATLIARIDISCHVGLSTSRKRSASQQVRRFVTFGAFKRICPGRQRGVHKGCHAFQPLDRLSKRRSDRGRHSIKVSAV